MGFSMLRWISQKVAAESSLRWISRKGAAGIFSSAGSSNYCGSKGAFSDQHHVRRFSDKESVLCPSRISPWLMLPPTFEDGDMVYKFYSLAENKVLSINKRRGPSFRERVGVCNVNVS